MLKPIESTRPAEALPLGDETLDKALFLLSRPASLAALAVLLLNDHLLRRLWPSWWTGKLGDFAWLYLMPLAAVALFALLLPRRLGRREDLIACLAFGATGGVFSLAKTLPFFHACLVRGLEALLGFPVGWQRDPTDLIALLSLGAAWYAWRRYEILAFSRGSIGWVVLPLVALLTMANSPAPNSGIACLEVDHQHILASSAYLGFVSADGGLTWQASEQQRCQRQDQTADNTGDGGTVISDPTAQDVQYRFKPGAAIERSEDAGKTWRAEFNLSPPGQAERLYMEKTHTGLPAFRPGPLDALVDPNTGNAIFAMGFEGILVRKAGGEWVWAAAGDYRHTTPLQITQPGSIFSFLSGEFVLAVLVGLLLMDTLTLRLNSHRLRMLVLGLGWLSWIISAAIFPPSLTQGYAGFFTAASFVVTVVFVVPFSLESLFRIVQNCLRALPRLLFVAVSGTLLFFLPYILWALNGLPDYYLAVGFGSVLAAATLLVGYVRTRSLIVKKQATA